MDQEKFFLHSKTIIGVIIMMLVQIGPMLGVSFTQEDGNILMNNFDVIATSLGALIAVWGRVAAKSDLVVFKSKRPTDPTLSHPLLGLGLMVVVLLAACTPETVTPRTPQQTFYSIKSSYTIAKEEAAAYAALPFCTETLIVSCAKPEIVIKLDEAADVADAAFAQADTVFAAITSNPLEQETALGVATVALRQLTAILALAVVAESQT